MRSIDKFKEFSDLQFFYDNENFENAPYWQSQTG